MLIPFETLQKKYRVNPKGVLHVGANVGEERHAYSKAGILDVIWIEANEDLISQLIENTRIPGARHIVYHLCVSDTTGEDVTLHIANNAGQSSSILELGTHKIAHPDVHYIKDIKMKTTRLDDKFESGFNGIDFLNIDLQGAELKALRGMGDLLKGIKWAYIEVNKRELYKGCALIEDIDMYLIGFGFKRVETRWEGNTGWGDAFYVRR